MRLTVRFCLSTLAWVMLFLSSCTKTEELATPRTQQAVSAAEIQLLKQVFVDRHYAQQFRENKQTWVPLWDQATRPQTAESSTAIYVPLALYRTDKAESITLVGFKKYLRIEQVGTARTFSVAFYLATLPKQPLDVPRWVSWYQNPDFLTTFTGTRALKELTIGQSSLLDYQNGEALPALNHSRASARTATAAKTAANQNTQAGCAEYDTWCFWNIDCPGLGPLIGYPTRGLNTDCETPPSLCTDAKWERTSTETFYYCPLNTKLRIDPAYEIFAPKLFQTLNNIRSFVESNPKVLDGLMKFSGQTKEQILYDLTHGNGPEVEIGQPKDDNGNSVIGQFRRSNPNVLTLDGAFINQFEHTNSVAASQALSFYLAVAVLHEYTHYGDYARGINFLGEEGTEFEQAVFGVIVGEDNAGQVMLNFTNNP
jgi:hypothetical protein